jgi:hypothetical protein
MFTPTRDFLEANCREPPGRMDRGRATELVHAMGPLGRIWLRPEIVAAADAFVGQAPRTAAAAPNPGECRVLLLTPGRNHYGSLRPAFVLPLRWIEGCHDSPRLPPGLAEEASRIIASHGEEFGIRPPASGRWSLHLGGRLDDACDLSRLDFDCGWSSATAALLAGLDLATLGTTPDVRVMASVAWGGSAFACVDGVGAKLDAAADAGAEKVFLAAANEPDVNRWRDSNPQSTLVVRLLQPASTLCDSLAPYFRAIEARPSATAPLSILQRFYAHRLPRGTARWDFYVHSLAARLAREYAGPRPLAGPCLNLIGIVAPGASPPMAFLAQLLGPARILLLHDATAAGDAVKLEAHLRADLGIDASRHQFATVFGPLDDCRAELSQAIGSFLGSDTRHGTTPDTVIDLTGGTKRLTFLLLEHTNPRIACVHLDNERSAAGDVEQIGTEKVVSISVKGHRTAPLPQF